MLVQLPWICSRLASRAEKFVIVPCSKQVMPLLAFHYHAGMPSQCRHNAHCAEMSAWRVTGQMPAGCQRDASDYAHCEQMPLGCTSQRLESRTSAQFRIVAQ